jgi:hypothetical protein
MAGNWRASVALGGNPGTVADSFEFAGDPDADEDGDGLSAFAEHAFGTSDSDGANSQGNLTASIAADGHLTVTYQRNLAADDAVMMVETSTDLTAWNPANGGPIQLETDTHNGDGTATITYQTKDPIIGSQKLFVRLRISSR